MRSARSHGVTLVELIVVLAVLGVILGVSTLSLASLRAPRETTDLAELRLGRREAIGTGNAVTVRPSARPLVLFLPDGRAIGPGADYLTGAPRAP